MQGNKLQLSLGFSHPVEVDIPAGLTVKVENNTKIEITGFDKQLLGQFASEIRAKRPPEPFKGKGVKYADEHIVRKEGKKNKDLSQMLSSRQMFERRRVRNRTSLKKNANSKPRLSVHRSSRHIYAQIIDDATGSTLASASTLEADFKKIGKTGADMQPLQLLASLLVSGLLAKGSRRLFLTVAGLFITVG